MRAAKLVKKYNFKFSKSLGQNFLVDDLVPRDIAAGAEVDENDSVAEIGPGVGTLTAQLLSKAKKVVTTELDNDLIPALNQEIGDNPKFTLIRRDALKVNFNEIIGEKKSVRLAANLPYHVTMPIIVKLLKEGYNFESLTIMIQKEVAERMNANPGDKDYGSPSLLVRYYCNTKTARRVSPQCLIPRPKVDSIAIRLDKSNEPKAKVENEKLSFDAIRNPLNMRRKTLWGGVKNIGLNKKNLELAFNGANTGPKRRGETLTIEEFTTLSDKINQHLR